MFATKTTRLCVAATSHAWTAPLPLRCATQFNSPAEFDFSNARTEDDEEQAGRGNRPGVSGNIFGVNTHTLQVRDLILLELIIQEPC